jgi:hypothetical protein
MSWVKPDSDVARLVDHGNGVAAAADQAHKPVVVADRYRRRGRESPARERRNHVRG